MKSRLGYADYLGALQCYRVECPYDSHLLAVSTYLINYPFANRLFPNSLDVIEHCRRWGPVVILSDGDVVFQPRKVEPASSRRWRGTSSSTSTRSWSWPTWSAATRPTTT